MLVIFDTQSRTAGVAEYLINGEKVCSSKYTKDTGLSRYLNKGRNGDRDIKDMRTPLLGDLDALDEVIKMGTAKGASESYRNIVLSFEEDEISNKHLNEIVNSFLDTYMVGYNRDEYYAYAEAHRPKIKYKIDENGNKVKRHLHVHLSIAKYSVKHDRLLDMGHNGEYVKTGGRLKEVEHWKKLTEKKYGLKPTETKPISNGNSYKDKTLQQTREGLISFCESKSQSLNSLNELVKELKKFDFIESIKKSKKARTPYISIKLNGKSIRLKGDLFSDKTFNQAKEQLTNKTKEHVYNESKEPREVDIPQEFVNLQKARADKVNRDMTKIRAKYKDTLADLKPLQMSDSYKEWMRNKEYKNTEMVSPLSFRVNDIKSQQKNKINIETFNQRIDARVLLHILKDSHNINQEIYNPYLTKDGKYQIEVGTHKYSPSEFLQEHMNFDWEETVKTLSYVSKQQSKHLYNSSSIKNIYQRMSYQNKVFIDIYHSHTSLDLSSFYIKKDDEHTTLKKRGITIRDQGDVIQSKYNQDVKSQVEIMLELIRAKEWDIQDIEIEGTDEFKYEVVTQIRELERNEKVENEQIKPKKRRHK